VIEINTDRCTGCAACVEVCPTGALYLVEDKAVVDRTLCRECEACLHACPAGAIIRADELSTHGSGVTRVPISRPATEIVRMQSQPLLIPSRSKVLPWLGMALIWAGREIVPRLAEHLLYNADRRLVNWQPNDIRQSVPEANSVGDDLSRGGRRRRRRHGG